LYPNIRHSRVLWTKRHADLFDFGASFVKKISNVVGWEGRTANLFDFGAG